MRYRSHFRAHIRLLGRTGGDRNGMPVYEFRIINRNTGAVIARDDHCGMSKLHDQARELVTACHLAWSYELRRKDLM